MIKRLLGADNAWRLKIGIGIAAGMYVLVPLFTWERYYRITHPRKEGRFNFKKYFE